MKRIAMLLGLAVAVPLAHAQSLPLRATLVGFEEVPAVRTGAQGSFEARLSNDEKTVEYTLTYSGLQAPVTQAHIHYGQRAVNGSIIVWLCGTTTNPGPAGTPPCPGSGGTVSGTFTSANVLASSITTQQFTAGDLASLVDAMRDGLAYVNIHSTVSPGGEVRGQFHTHGKAD